MGVEGSTPAASNNISFFINHLNTILNFVQKRPVRRFLRRTSRHCPVRPAQRKPILLMFVPSLVSSCQWLEPLLRFIRKVVSGWAGLGRAVGSRGRTLPRAQILTAGESCAMLTSFRQSHLGSLA